MSAAAATADVRRPLRVAVMADDPARRRHLLRALAVLGYEIAEADEAPDVVVTDAERRGVGGVPAVALGGVDDDQAALLARDASDEQIDAALRAVAAGLVVRMRNAAPAFDMLPEKISQPLLTPRETEVLNVIADGLSNKEIGRRMDISLHTVKFHIESLLRKLGARSRAEAVAKGLARRRDDAIEI